MGEKGKVRAHTTMHKTIAIILGLCLCFPFLPGGMAAFAASTPIVVFDNYPEVSTYIETCEVGDTYTLTARLKAEDVEENAVTWVWSWATPSQVIGNLASTAGNTATIEALAIGNTKITATAMVGGDVIASAQAILNVIQRSDYDEPWRPQFHFSQNTNWCNDPNGLVYYDGEWHLFFQYNPYSNRHGNLSWGHAVSTDLVNWEELEVSLYPDNATFGNTAQPGFVNLGSIFSGSAVVDENNTTGFFTDTPEKKGLVAIFTHSGSPGGQQQSIAYSTDKGRTWLKYEGNPVISSARAWEGNGSRAGDPGDPLNNTAFRDPKVIWHKESNQWIMVVAGGPIRFYSSPDLINWKAEAMQPEIVTECPDFFELAIDGTGETKWVLVEGGRYYRIGSFQLLEEGTYAGKWGFVTDSDPSNSDPYSAISNGIARYYMNYGADAYAAQTYSDGPDGRRVLVQWMSNWSYANRSLYNILKPYNGQFTLQEELSLTKIGDGSIRLQQTPVQEYELLRKDEKILSDVTITPENNVMEGLRGETFEIKAQFTPEPGAKEVGIKFRIGGGYETIVKYNFEEQTVYTDKSKAGPKTHLINDVEVGFVDNKQNGEHWNFFDGRLIYNANNYEAALAAGEEIITVPYAKYTPMEDGTIDLHIFVDRSSVETHAGRYTTLGTCLFLPHQTEAGDGIEVYSVGGNVQADIEFYKLGSIWHEEESTLYLSTTAHNLKAGDSFNVNTSFREEQKSNTVVLNYTFDGSKFEYVSYDILDGVGLVDEQYGDGFAQITLMVPGYNAKSLGSLTLRAKVDAILSSELQTVSAEATYVLKDDAGNKTIHHAEDATSFTTLGTLLGDTNDDGIIDIIDLSNMIDWFGTTSNNAEWETLYTFFDFNNDGMIDISDISYVAKLII